MRYVPSIRRTTSPTARTYARAPLESGATPWRQAHYCVVDLELTGLDPKNDEIISYGAVPIDSGRIMAGGAVYGLFRPTRALSESSVLIHGIRTVDLVGAPEIDEAILPLVEAMTGRALVVHVSWVERSFLGRALARQDLRLRGPVIDTYELGQSLSRRRRGSPAPRGLDELARSLSLPVHQPHHALGDALTTAQVFLALAAHLEEFEPQTLRSLSRAK